MGHEVNYGTQQAMKLQNRIVPSDMRLELSSLVADNRQEIV